MIDWPVLQDYLGQDQECSRLKGELFDLQKINKQVLGYMEDKYNSSPE